MGGDCEEHAIVVPKADHAAWCVKSKALSTVISFLYILCFGLDSSKSTMRGNMNPILICKFSATFSLSPSSVHKVICECGLDSALL